MIKKIFFASFIATALIFATNANVLAQTAQTRGVVKIQQADGTLVPLQDATIDVYRTDIAQKKPQTAKTNKRGEFVFAGLMLGATYTIATSAPNASPDVFAGVRAGQEDIAITLRAGDGKRLTLDEIKSGVTSPKTLSTSSTPTPTATPTQTTADAKPRKESAEDKKAREDADKKNAEITAKNAKIEGANKIIDKALKEGNDAYNAAVKSRTAKDNDNAVAQFTTAAAKYDEGYNADPDYLGTAPVLLTNKSAALLGAGIVHYNLAVTNKDAAARAAAVEVSKKDFQAAYDAANKASLMFKNAPAAANPADAKAFETAKYNALSQRADSARLLVKADSSKVPDAVTAYQEYIAVETDAKKKSEAQYTSADLALQAGEIDSAVTQFKAILAQDPKNTKVIGKLGFALTATGDKAKTQEGVDYLQQFIDASSDSDPDKGYAKATLEELKNEQKIVPAKGAGKSVKKKS